MSTRTGHAYAYCVRVLRTAYAYAYAYADWKKGREMEKKTRGTYAGLIHGKRKNKLNRTLNKKPKSIM